MFEKNNSFDFKFLFKSINSSSLGAFRVVFGCLAFFDVLNHYVYYHLTIKAYEPENFQFRYYGFEWLPVFPEPWMSLFFLGLMAAALGIVLGIRYRWSTFLFALGFTYLFLLEKSFYLNHGYLFCWLSWIMAFLPADARYVIGKQSEIRQTIPYWPIWLLRFMMALVYFYAGIAKLNADWLAGLPLKLWLPTKTDSFIIGPLLEFELTAMVMSYAGLLLDLSAPFLLWFSRTRVVIFVLLLSFHVTNALIFNIGIFPYLSIALTALFFKPDFPESWLIKWDRQKEFTNEMQTYFPMNRGVRFSLIVLALLHVFLPLRPHFFKNHTAWTEDGHRYSWRMMLRSKSGYGVFIVEDIHSGTKEEVQPRDHLGKRQVNKLFTHPDMILQFAHFLRDQYQAKGKEVEVYADIKIQLNGRKFKHYIDPKVNLAKEEWSFWHSKAWVMPFKESRGSIQ